MQLLLHVIMPEHHMEVSGQFHTTATIPKERSLLYPSDRGWVDLTACLAVVCLFREVKDAVSD
jgi:hypothetical protein